jgi:hypothetical protein
MKQTAIEKVLIKINSVKLCLMAHPNNEVNSEFADRILDLQEIEIELLKYQQERSYSKEEIMNALHSVELKYNRDFTKIYEGVSKYLKELKNK